MTAHCFFSFRICFVFLLWFRPSLSFARSACAHELRKEALGYAKSARMMLLAGCFPFRFVWVRERVRVRFSVQCIVVSRPSQAQYSSNNKQNIERARETKEKKPSTERKLIKTNETIAKMYDCMRMNSICNACKSSNNFLCSLPRSLPLSFGSQRIWKRYIYNTKRWMTKRFIRVQFCGGSWESSPNAQAYFAVWHFSQRFIYSWFLVVVVIAAFFPSSFSAGCLVYQQFYFSFKWKIHKSYLYIIYISPYRWISYRCSIARELTTATTLHWGECRVRSESQIRMNCICRPRVNFVIFANKPKHNTRTHNSYLKLTWQISRSTARRSLCSFSRPTRQQQQRKKMVSTNTESFSNRNNVKRRRRREQRCGRWTTTRGKSTPNISRNSCV